MTYIKRRITEEERLQYEHMRMKDPVTMQPSEARHVTLSERDMAYLISLSNQRISFIYEMPRYFCFSIKEEFIFFFVINQAEKGSDDAKVIYVKGMKVPEALEEMTDEILPMIEEALMVYYSDYEIAKLSIESKDKIQYYSELKDGVLYY